jgi:hypothetical protein
MCFFDLFPIPHAQEEVRVRPMCEQFTVSNGK